MLAHEDRMDRFQAIMSFIKPNVSMILDLGCGIGALTSLLAERIPASSIVGIDKSKYLLTELNNKRMKPNILLVQGDVPIFPLKPETFNLIVAVQVMHEIFHFRGKQEPAATINSVYNLLRRGGDFITLGYRNLGNTIISVRLSKELLGKLRYFQLNFQPRKISYKILDKKWIKISMRDFYDFVTKSG